jgi:hypothetical protein
MLARLRPRLTYANVVATVALFVALGGGAYASGLISGSKLRDRSVSGAKLRPHTVSATEINASKLVADRVKGVLVTHRRRARRRAASAAATSASTANGLYGLAFGETRVVLESRPFQIIGRCADSNENGHKRLEVLATSSEDNWYLYGEKHNAGDRVVLSGITESPFFIPSGAVVAMAAPSGAVLQLGQILMGTGLFGSDCVVGAFAIGGSS